MPSLPPARLVKSCQATFWKHVRGYVYMTAAMLKIKYPSGKFVMLMHCKNNQFRAKIIKTLDDLKECTSKLPYLRRLPKMNDLQYIFEEKKLKERQNFTWIAIVEDRQLNGTYFWINERKHDFKKAIKEAQSRRSCRKFVPLIRQLRDFDDGLDADLESETEQSIVERVTRIKKE